jgi:hypothetical protein
VSSLGDPFLIRGKTAMVKVRGARPMGGSHMPVSIEDVIEAAATGFLKALDAGGNPGRKGSGDAKAYAANLIKAGFSVSFSIRSGGSARNAGDADLNPQPLPPKIPTQTRR